MLYLLTPIQRHSMLKLVKYLKFSRVPSNIIGVWTERRRRLHKALHGGIKTREMTFLYVVSRVFFIKVRRLPMSVISYRYDYARKEAALAFRILCCDGFYTT